jgi:hypothetical protein
MKKAPVNNMRCYRCHKPIAMYTQFASVAKRSGLSESAPTHPYHLKCLPPNLFHQLAHERTGRARQVG